MIGDSTISGSKSPFQRIMRNMGHLLSGKAVAGIMSMVYIALAARALGVGGYGTLNLVHAYATFFGTLLALSGFHGIVRYGARSLQAMDYVNFWALVRLLAAIELSMAFVAMICAALLSPFAVNLLHLSDAAAEWMIYYVLAIFATARATPQGVLQLANRFDLIGLQQTVMPVVRLIGVAILWWFGAGLTGFLFVWLASALLEGLSMWVIAYVVARRKGWVSQTNFSVKEILGAHDGLVRFVGVTNIDLTLRDLAPKATPLIIGWMLGPVATGLYVLAQRASAVLVQPAQLLSQASYSVIAELAVGRQFAKANAALRKSIAMSATGGGAAAILFTLFPQQILQLLGGRAFAAGGDLLIMIGLASAILSITPVLSAAVTAFGYPGRSTAINLSCSLGTLPLLFFLLGQFGVNGAGIYALIQSTLFTVLLALSYHHLYGRIANRAA